MKRILAATMLVLMAIIFCTARAHAEPPRRWLPVDEDGWTILRPSEDSRIHYVSSSSGDDDAARAYPADHTAVGKDPFHPAGSVKPFRTISAALSHARDGHPDWVLLKRGDSWSEPLGDPPDGRSRSQPFVVSSYGEAPDRPQIRLHGRQSGVRFDIHEGCRNLAIVGLEFYAPGKDPDSPEFTRDCRVKTGIQLFVSGKPRAQAHGLLIEDCCLRFCGATFMLARDRSPDAPEPIKDLVFRRNLVLGNYSRTSHAQGTYAARVSILLEENIYDHNGWLIQERGNRKKRGGATMFNHNTYFCDCHDVAFRGNMFLRASSIGNKWTANSGPGSARNLVMDNNLYVEGEIGISAGGNKAGPRRFKNVHITDNVLMHIGRGRPTLRNLGWGIDVQDWDGGAVTGNAFVHRPDENVTNVYSLSMGASDESGLCRDVAVHDNVFCGAPVKFTRHADRLRNVEFARNTVLMPWLEMPLIRTDGTVEGCSFSNNTYSSRSPVDEWFNLGGERVSLERWAQEVGDKGSRAQSMDLPRSKRTVEAYMAHLGMEPSFDAFIAEVRKQSKENWREQFTAAAINEWVREGYGVSETQ